jgi:hypothetical protein
MVTFAFLQVALHGVGRYDRKVSGPELIDQVDPA